MSDAQQNQPVISADDDKDGALANAATSLVSKLLSVGIDGVSKFDSAQQVAKEALAERGSREGAISAVVASHIKLAAAGGFITSVGGFITLPVALPANVAGFYVLATRMTAAIAAIQGYDLRDDSVRSSVLLTLAGADAHEILRKAGSVVPVGRVATFATQKLPSTALMAVNKGVAFRLLTQTGQRTFAKLGRAVPLAGGVIGGGLDAFLMKQTASHAQTQFPVRSIAGSQ